MTSVAAELQIEDLPVRVREAVYLHVYANPDHEVGGVLVGSVDGRTGKPRVTGAIPALEAVGARASVTFTHDAWETIIEQQEAEFPGTRILGWYHSHPDFGIFLSEHDIFIHQNFFADLHQFAYVVDPIGGTEGVFGWRDGKVALFSEGDVPDVDESGVPREPLAQRVVVALDEDAAADDVELEPPSSLSADSMATYGTRGPRRVVELEDDEPTKRPLGLIVGIVAAVLLLVGGAVAVSSSGGGTSTATQGKGVNKTEETGEQRAQRRRIESQRRQARAAQAAAQKEIAAAVARTKYVPPKAKPKLPPASGGGDASGNVSGGSSSGGGAGAGGGGAGAGGGGAGAGGGGAGTGGGGAKTGGADGSGQAQTDSNGLK